MQQRKSSASSGRPSGTDGYDFSYRMVVDSRYTKVAKGKSCLSKLTFTQVAVSIAVIRLGINVVKTGSALEVIKNPTEWETKKFELLETACILLGSVAQLFLVSTIISLIDNMSPPKKAS